ncbi:MAG: UDP-glucose/GDP-mannose dehydrogenase family protein [Pseudomonadota bacterium]
MARIAIIGAGYVGLVSAGCFAKLGHNVFVYDIDAQRINNLQAGILTIFEPGLEAIIAEGLHKKTLTFCPSLPSAIEASEAIFICVGTPQSPDGTADMRHVEDVTQSLAPLLGSYKVIVDKSTVPMGTARELTHHIAASNPQAQFDVISNPEFLREGEAVNDFLNPDRIVIGMNTQAPRALMEQIYAPLSSQGVPILWVSSDSAELIKYATNAFLAVKLSFVNELSDLCEESHAVIDEVIAGLGADIRIGRTFLNPGPGYGGSCFPKDTKAILQKAQNLGVTLSLIECADNSNTQRKRNLIAKVAKIAGPLKGKRIAILGLSFKANTDDIRESPAWDLVPALKQAGAKLVLSDPQALWPCHDDGPLVRDPHAAVTDADCAVILTEWNEYRQLPWKQLAPMMAHPIVIDFRNLYNHGNMHESGVSYYP